MAAKPTTQVSKPKFASAYGIFEGGGARGLAHVGALTALERAGIALVGVAGTSAGAIIASLVAVGYTPQEIFSSGKDNILTRVGRQSPVDELGRKEWKRVRGFKKRAVTFGVLLALGLLAFLVSAIWSGIAIWDGYDPAIGWVAIGGAVLVLLSLLYFGLWIYRVTKSVGIFKSEVIRDIVNDALREKLKIHYKANGLEPERVPDVVTFGDIDPKKMGQCIPLKIVTTDVSNGRLTLFDRLTPSVSVADAVAASAALPFAFRPARIPQSRATDSNFTDGGLVSNLPAWVFRKEKQSRERLEASKGGYARIPIYAFTLTDPVRAAVANADEANPTVIDSLKYFAKVVMTGIFGSQSIVQEFIPDLKIVEITTKLKTIDFDCTGEQASAAVTSGFDGAWRYLERNKIRNMVTNAALAEIHRELEKQLAQRRGVNVADLPRLRVVLIDPVTSEGELQIEGFRVVGGANMRQFADDRLELDLERSIAARAYGENGATFGMLHGRSHTDLFMTKYEYAMLPDDLHSVIAVPVYAGSQNEESPQRILSIDSNDDLGADFADDAFLDKIISMSAVLSKKLIDDTVSNVIAKKEEQQ